MVLSVTGSAARAVSLDCYPTHSSRQSVSSLSHSIPSSLPETRSIASSLVKLLFSKVSQVNRRHTSDFGCNI